MRPFLLHCHGTISGLLHGDSASVLALTTTAPARRIATTLGGGDPHELPRDFGWIIGTFGKVPILPTLPGWHLVASKSMRSVVFLQDSEWTRTSGDPNSLGLVVPTSVDQHLGGVVNGFDWIMEEL